MDQKSIKKITSETREQKIALDKQEQKLKCRCVHKNNHNEPQLAKKQNGANLEYVCRTCSKDIDLSKVTDEDLRSAIKTIDKCCDAIKMSLDPNKESDEKVIKEVAKMQYFSKMKFESYYRNSLKRGGKSKGNDNRSSSGLRWGQARTR